MTQTLKTDVTADLVETLRATDGTARHYEEWQPSGPREARGLIQIIHGYGEHISRYGTLARALNAAGFLVGGGDHPGMGRSEGVKGFVDDYETYLQELAIPQTRLRRKRDSLPLFLYGHSMGGLIALLHAERGSAQPVSGTVLSGPFLGAAMPVPFWQVALGRVVMRVSPQFRVPVPFNAPMLTHDKEAQEATLADPLALRHTTLGWFFASGRAIETAKRDVRRIAWPTLWLIPGGDLLCSVAASRAFFRCLPEPDKHTWREYPGLYHELHRESPADRDRVFADLIAWLEAHL